MYNLNSGTRIISAVGLEAASLATAGGSYGFWGTTKLFASVKTVSSAVLKGASYATNIAMKGTSTYSSVLAKGVELNEDLHNSQPNPLVSLLYATAVMAVFTVGIALGTAHMVLNAAKTLSDGIIATENIVAKVASPVAETIVDSLWEASEYTHELAQEEWQEVSLSGYGSLVEILD